MKPNPILPAPKIQSPHQISISTLSPNLKVRLSIHNLNLRLLQLHHMRMSRSSVDILHEFLQDVIFALCFTFDLFRGQRVNGCLQMGGFVAN